MLVLVDSSYTPDTNQTPWSPEDSGIRRRRRRENTLDSAVEDENESRWNLLSLLSPPPFSLAEAHLTRCTSLWWRKSQRSFSCLPGLIHKRRKSQQTTAAAAMLYDDEDCCCSCDSSSFSSSSRLATLATFVWKKEKERGRDRRKRRSGRGRKKERQERDKNTKHHRHVDENTAQVKKKKKKKKSRETYLQDEDYPHRDKKEGISSFIFFKKKKYSKIFQKNELSSIEKESAPLPFLLLLLLASTQTQQQQVGRLETRR